MSYAVGRVRIVRIGNIVEEDHRVVFGSVQAAIGKGARLTGDIFLIGFPGDVRLLEERDEMHSGGLIVIRWQVIIVNAKVGSSLKPEIVWFAGVIIWWIVILLRIGRHREQRIVNIGSIRTSLDL